MRQILFALFPALLLVASCAMNPATGRPHFTLVSEKGEFELGHEVVQNAIKAEGLYTELPELVNTYRDIGARLVSVTERADKPFDFLIIDSPTFNAWATPGYVNFYRGILAHLNSEAELIAIMGHEVGHITARHSVRQMSSGVLTQALVLGGAVVLALNTDSAALGQAAILTGGIVAGIGLRAYGRSAEFEADDLGGRYLERMNYPAEEVANAIRTLAVNEDLMKKQYRELFDEDLPTSPIYHVFASHPPSGTRVDRLENKYGSPELRSFERAPQLQNDTVGRAKYLQLINGMAYGPKKEHGVITRDRIYMPKDRFALNLPSGYFAAYGLISPGWAVGDVKNNRYLNVATTNLRRSASVEEALRISAPRARNVRTFTVGNTSIAAGEIPNTAHAEKDKITQVIYAIAGADNDDDTKDKSGNLTRRYQLFNFNVRTRDMTDEDRKVFEDTVKTYKNLNAAEAERVEPLRIGVYTVRPGDTVASISRNMPLGSLREETFRTLNGMRADDEVKAGMLMKILVDKNTVR